MCCQILASKACFKFAADLGFKEIHVEALPCYIMAGKGGGAGPAPDIRHQPPGKELNVYHNIVLALLAQWLRLQGTICY